MKTCGERHRTGAMSAERTGGQQAERVAFPRMFSFFLPTHFIIEKAQKFCSSYTNICDKIRYIYAQKS
jgi:hypothetical protein